MDLRRESFGAARGLQGPTGWSRGLPPPLPPLRCRGGRPEASAPERTGVGPVGESGGDRAQCRGDAPRCGGAPRGPVALRSRCSEVARLRGRRRKAEELGDDGFGGAQHRGDQRRQVEAALAGGAHDAGQDLLGCARQTGGGWPRCGSNDAGCASSTASTFPAHFRPCLLTNRPVESNAGAPLNEYATTTTPRLRHLAARREGVTPGTCAWLPKRMNSEDGSPSAADHHAAVSRDRGFENTTYILLFAKPSTFAGCCPVIDGADRVRQSRIR